MTHTILRVATALGLTATLCSAAAQPLPDGWRRSGSASDEYRIVRAEEAKRTGTYGVIIEFTSGKAEGFGAIIQNIAPDNFLGKKMLLRAWIKTEEAGSAALWVRVDGKASTLGLDNMDNRPIKGTNPWRQYELVIQVPTNSAQIAFGVLLAGRGRVAVDDVEIGIADAATPTTTIYGEKELLSEVRVPIREGLVPLPKNLDFER